MITIEIRQSAKPGWWIAEEQGQSLCDPYGFGESIQEAMEQFLKSYTIMIGTRPQYKWIGDQHTKL